MYGNGVYGRRSVWSNTFRGIFGQQIGFITDSRAIPRERGTSLLYHGTNRTLQLARYHDLINFEKKNHVLGSYFVRERGYMKGGQFGQKPLGAFLVNKSVLLPRVELYHVKEEPLYFIMVLIGPSN